MMYMKPLVSCTRWLSVEVDIYEVKVPFPLDAELLGVEFVVDQNEAFVIFKNLSNRAIGCCQDKLPARAASTADNEYVSGTFDRTIRTSYFS